MAMNGFRKTCAFADGTYAREQNPLPLIEALRGGSSGRELPVHV